MTTNTWNVCQKIDSAAEIIPTLSHTQSKLAHAIFVDALTAAKEITDEDATDKNYFREYGKKNIEQLLNHKSPEGDFLSLDAKKELVARLRGLEFQIQLNLK